MKRHDSWSSLIVSWISVRGVRAEGSVLCVTVYGLRSVTPVFISFASRCQHIWRCWVFDGRHSLAILSLCLRWRGTLGTLGYIFYYAFWCWPANMRHF